jgi:hypothetical protein
MARHHQIYWYRENKDVAAAALWHVRDQDLTTGGGIARGAIVQGHYGVAVAECDVPALSGCIVAFQATRRCRWQERELACMVHPQLPGGALTKAELSAYNYCVAELTEPDDIALASRLNVPPVRTADGRTLVNLELANFSSQTKPRKALLL